jgi:hypothetical protein
MPHSAATVKLSFALQYAVDRALAGYIGRAPILHLTADCISPILAKVAFCPELLPEGDYLLLDIRRSTVGNYVWAIRTVAPIHQVERHAIRTNEPSLNRAKADTEHPRH